MRKLLKLATIATLSSTFIAPAAVAEDQATDRFVYIGSELGISDPVVKSFTDKDSKTKIRLKKSRMLGGKIGYSFYPNMMIELSFTHQPKFRMAYRLPKKDNAGIPETPGITKVLANVITLNLIYELEKTVGGIKPYVIFGAGVTKVTVKPTNSKFNFPFLGDTDYFRINKTSTNCLTWQAGVGLSREIFTNFSADISAKMQVVQGIKVKYDTLVDPATKTYQAEKPIKKTIGVGEFALGFTYKLPF